jgi:hypothetical protein
MYGQTPKEWQGCVIRCCAFEAFEAKHSERGGGGGGAFEAFEAKHVHQSTCFRATIKACALEAPLRDVDKRHH